MQHISLSRRRFLQGSAAIATSGLFISCSADMPQIQLQHGHTAPSGEMHHWLFIGTDNHIILTIPCADMGQGVNTSLAQLAADELDADWQSLEIRQAPLDSKFNGSMGMQLTSGSSSIKQFYLPMRQVGAAARQMILKAAAAQLNTSIDQLTTNQSQVIFNGQTYPYGQFAADAASLPLPSEVALKTDQQMRLIGKGLTHRDTRSRVTGQAGYGIDVQVPNMLNAALVQAPIFGAQPDKWNETAALQVNGVRKVLAIDHALVVVADKYWQAKKGAAALQASFSEPALDLPGQSTAEVRQAYTDGLNEQGQAQLKQPHIIDVEYSVPWLAHATMEPINCTAWVQADRLDLWLPTQSQSTAADAAAAVSGLDREQVHVHNQLLGGGFGRRSESDFVTQAVQVAMLMQQPVKLIWSREEDIQHDFYRPMMISRMQVGLDTDYNPVAWHNQMASSPILKRLIKASMPSILKWLPVTKVIGDPIVSAGAEHIPYLPADTSPDTELLLVDTNIPVGTWRSVGHSATAFFTESIIDEAALLAQQDPYTYRTKLLNHSPREQAVLDMAAQQANWGQAPANHFQGIAVVYAFESYTAMVVELSVNNKAVTVHKVTCAVDCGKVINPNGAKAQIEGGINFALSAAMQGEITVQDGRVEQSNFHDYPIMRLAQAPLIHVHLIPSQEAPTGLGEVGVPPLAPALANALVAAGQPRVRDLPFSKAGFYLA
jgi:isoquinoline 1-oxidoreductase beta subunit